MITGTFGFSPPQYLLLGNNSGFQATQTIFFSLIGDGASTSFQFDLSKLVPTNLQLGTPSAPTASVTSQQVSGFPPSYKPGTYATNTIISAPNGTLQKCTTPGTSSGSPWLPFSSVLNATTPDGSIVWTCIGPNTVTRSFDAPTAGAALAGTVLTLTFSEALKSVGTIITDTYGNVFTIQQWQVAVVLTYASSTANVNNVAGVGLAPNFGQTTDSPPQIQPIPLTAGGTAAKVDGSAVVQPVSGTVSVALLSTLAGACAFSFINATGVARSVKVSSGNLYGMYFFNNTAATAFLEFFNVPGVPVLGTTAVVMAFPIPANGVVNIPPDIFALANFSSGIGFGCTTTIGGSTAASVTGVIYTQ